MTQFYTDESRADDTWSLPDAEAFYAQAGELGWEGQEEPSEAGWYYWHCFPGCMPDSDPIGPFGSMAEAIEHAREDNR